MMDHRETVVDGVYHMVLYNLLYFASVPVFIFGGAAKKVAGIDYQNPIMESFHVTMATNLPSCFSIQFLQQLLKFLVNFTLLKYVKSQRSYCFLITKELIFWLPYFGFKRSFFQTPKLTRSCTI